MEIIHGKLGANIKGDIRNPETWLENSLHYMSESGAYQIQAEQLRDFLGYPEDKDPREIAECKYLMRKSDMENARFWHCMMRYYRAVNVENDSRKCEGRLYEILASLFPNDAEIAERAKTGEGL